MPPGLWCFHSGCWEKELLLAQCELWVLFPQILLGGSFPCLSKILHMHGLTSIQMCTQGASFADLQYSLSVQLSPLCYSALWALAAMASLDPTSVYSTQRISPSERSLTWDQALPRAAHIWRLREADVLHHCGTLWRPLLIPELPVGWLKLCQSCIAVLLLPMPNPGFSACLLQALIPNKCLGPRLWLNICFWRSPLEMIIKPVTTVGN